jgi:hypothetical protein
MTRNGKEKPTPISDKEVDNFELLVPLLHALHRDIQELAKKKQDGPLTQTRITMINRLLEKLRGLLGNDPAIEFLDTLDTDSVPQNADALLVLGQYISAMEVYKKRHTYQDALYNLKWKTGRDA